MVNNSMSFVGLFIFISKHLDYAGLKLYSRRKKRYRYFQAMLFNNSLLKSGKVIKKLE